MALKIGAKSQVLGKDGLDKGFSKLDERFESIPKLSQR
jgi:hypothetical protein